MRPDRDVEILRALGNRTRQVILDELAQGPATSAMLARALGSNTGVTSYHLRELARAGLVERAEQQGRAQFWRLAPGDVRFRDPQESDEPALAQSVIDLRLARLVTSVRHYLDRDDLDPGWRQAALFSLSVPTLSAEQLAGFARDYLALVERWSEQSRATPPGPAGRAVHLALFAFPSDPAAD